MSSFTREIPFLIVDGRQCVTELQCIQFREIGDFVRRFRNCFHWDELRRVEWYYPNGLDEMG